MKHLEDREQIALITWVRLMQSKHPELATIHTMKMAERAAKQGKVCH